MPQIINTNIASLNAQRNLNNSQSALNTSLERLSSGLRINSAKDDAAGLAIVERFTAQIRGLNQAARNANDGVSLAQTAEGALTEVTNGLQRIRELAVQSANATNSSSDRAALNAEASQLIAEIERVATQTTFNGNNLLDGTFNTQTFQVGANAGETIGLSINSGVRTTQLGQIAEGTGASAVSAVGITAGDVTINGATVATSVVGSGNGQSADSAFAKAAAVNASGIGGVTATAVTGTRASDNASVGVEFTAAAQAYNLDINGTTIYSHTASGAGDGDLTQQELVDRINLFSNETGVTATVNGTGIDLTAADGRNIDLTGTTSTANDAGFDTADVTRGSVQLSSSDNITIVDANDRLGFGASATVTVDTTTLSSVDVLTVANSNDTIRRVDAALETVSGIRADLGAIQSRFESTVRSISTTAENLSAARSRIQDADFAAETASLTRNSILQQAGVSILAQANALPQQVLSLLQ